MILGIDASNLRGGGGVTHLVELLGAADPESHGFSSVVLWAGRATRRQVADRRWLVKSEQPLIERTLIHRSFWQRFRLSDLARRAGCDVLFVPGGSFAGDFQPVVAMSQNLLPFEARERRRYGRSWMGLKLSLLRRTQSRTFRDADGVIFLTRYARDVVSGATGAMRGASAIIPHGIADRFVAAPGVQLPLDRYSPASPFRIVYVSIVDVYKHQWNVAEAVARLRASGMPVSLDLIGPAYPPALKRLRDVIDRLDPAGEFLHYRGEVAYDALPARYAEAGLCVFASSCENMPIILLEGMASGLPIACSNRGPMPEVLGDAGVYFDPEKVDDIAAAIRTLIDAPSLRAEMAAASSSRARAFSWRQCAADTFAFLAGVGLRRAPGAVMSR